MKAYIGNVDWADEGDVFFFSIESEERLQAMEELIKIIEELDLFYGKAEMYWGTNESFKFDTEDFLDFISKARDISEEEIKVLEKFEISGFDIYYNIETFIHDCINPWDDIPELSEEDLDRIEPLFLQLYDKDEWYNFRDELRALRE